MSSSGKAAISPSCLSFECFDTLTKSCIKCSDLFKDNTTPRPASQVKNAAALLPPSALPLLTLPASCSTAEPTLAPTLTSTFQIFGVPVLVGVILVLATLCGFLACKVEKWRRKRKAADEENKEARGPRME
ncbi:tumor necrosis factor receptor superfamily member 13C [Hirundo rustica]|uniref:tumor necrosis factor receptor superfamily member 13C n=1 Tax=Hirundo rustica TaxID=43150 RepID=UPI001A94D3F8|nr:tumor necrosis factor receptor superfamily member 13C [Hirundo rustica]